MRLDDGNYRGPRVSERPDIQYLIEYSTKLAASLSKAEARRLIFSWSIHRPSQWAGEPPDLLVTNANIHQALAILRDPGTRDVDQCQLRLDIRYRDV